MTKLWRSQTICAERSNTPVSSICRTKPWTPSNMFSLMPSEGFVITMPLHRFSCCAVWASLPALRWDMPKVSQTFKKVYMSFAKKICMPGPRCISLNMDGSNSSRQQINNPLNALKSAKKSLWVFHLETTLPSLRSNRMWNLRRTKSP